MYTVYDSWREEWQNIHTRTRARGSALHECAHAHDICGRGESRSRSFGRGWRRNCERVDSRSPMMYTHINTLQTYGVHYNIQLLSPRVSTLAHVHERATRTRTGRHALANSCLFSYYQLRAAQKYRVLRCPYSACRYRYRRHLFLIRLFAKTRRKCPAGPIGRLDSKYLFTEHRCGVVSLFNVRHSVLRCSVDVSSK